MSLVGVETGGGVRVQKAEKEGDHWEKSHEKKENQRNAWPTTDTKKRGAETHRRLVTGANPPSRGKKNSQKKKKKKSRDPKGGRRGPEGGLKKEATST